MNIGKTELKSGLILAPMAGFSDRAMRLVCRKYGAEYTVTEMVSAKAVTFGDKKTSQIARIGEDEGPVALQLFGSEPDVMAKATEMMSGGVAGFVPPVAIDINMGCPVNKIFSNGEGSALMRDPELIYRTGDIGLLNDRGELVFVCRKDSQIKHMGHRIELGEIESAALKIEGVARACCVYDNEAKRIVLFFVGDIEQSVLAKNMAGYLPRYMLPAIIEKLTTLPSTSNGKIDRKGLKERAQTL